MDFERYMHFREHLLASLSGAAALAVTYTALHQCVYLTLFIETPA